MLLKVGDKAVVYDNKSGHRYEIGTIVRIADVNTKDYFTVVEHQFEGYMKGDINFIKADGWFVTDDDVFPCRDNSMQDYI